MGVRHQIEELASRWYDPDTPSYEFVCTGAVTARGFAAWGDIHARVTCVHPRGEWSEEERAEVRSILVHMGETARSKGICLDRDLFGLAVGLAGPELDEAWGEYSLHAMSLTAWWRENRTRWAGSQP